MTGFLDATTAQSQLAEVARRKGLRADVAANANPELATRIAEQYRAAPWSQPGVVWASAEANATGAVQSGIGRMSARQSADLVDIYKPEKKNWFQRNVYDKIKTASRWTFAAMQTVPDLAQNAVSDFFDDGPEQGGTGPLSSISGWWHSTSLGSMMSDSEKSGQGFFAGKEAEELQAERARRYRGEINDHAFTLGRGAASVVFDADSHAFKFLSGTVDAAFNVVTDPTNFASGTVKALRAGRTILKVSATEGKLAARIAAGVATEAESKAWDASRVVGWASSNRSANRLFKFLGETSSISDVMAAYDWKITPEIAKRIAEESDPEKIKALVIGAASREGFMDASDDVAQGIFGNLEPGLVPGSLSQMPGTKILYEKNPIIKWAGRWTQEVPDSRVLIHGTSEQRTNAIRNYARFVKQLGKTIPEDEAKKLIDRIALAYANTGTSRDVFEVHGAFDDLVGTTLRSLNIPKELIRETIEGEKFLKDKLRANLIDEAGKHTDNGLLQSYIENGMVDEDTLFKIMGDKPVDVSELRFAGPTAYHDLIDRVQILPDATRIRRLTANPFYRRTLQRAIATKKGDPNALVSATDFLQNEIWKTSALATFGYMMRNFFDGQLRTSMKYGGYLTQQLGGGGSGMQIATAFTNPVEYWMWAGTKAGGRKKGGATILGELFDAENAGRTQMEYQRQMGKAAMNAMDNPTDQLDNLVRTGDFNPVEYSPESADGYITGTAQTLGKYRGDVVFRMILEGKDDNEILAFLNSSAGADMKENMLDNLRRGLPFTDSTGKRFVDPKTGKRSFIPVRIDTYEEQQKALSLLVNADYRKPISHLMEGSKGKANLEELQLAMLTNHVGRAETDTVDDIFLKSNGVQGVSGQGISHGEEYGVGTMFTRDLPEGQPALFAIEDVRIDPTTKQKFYDIRYLHNEEAFVGEGGRGADSLREIIKQKAEAGLLPKFALHETLQAPNTNIPTAVTQTLEGWRALNRFFFDNISAKAMKKFEKDPLFRQHYYKVVDENIDLLAPKEAKKILAKLEKMAAEEDVKIQNLASRTIIKKLKAQAESGSLEEGTARALDVFAGRTATNRMGLDLFDAAKKNNVEDALRIAAPFGSAWRQIMQKYMKTIAEDPTAVLRMQRAYNGLSEATAFSNGENGLFYKDPVTNEMMFTFPLSGQLTKLATGITAPFTAPVKRLTMGFSVMPGLGPVGQIAMSKILPDKPMFDEIADVFLPYGRSKGLVPSVLPGWASKMAEAIQADPSKMDSVFASTYTDTLRALSATGKYDLTTDVGQQELFDDAKDKARIISMFRAASQFIGPTSGKPNYQIETNVGDIYAGELVKEFQKMQTANYDGAVGKFLETYGEEAALYVSSKTRSIYGGLEATSEFSNFERDNKRFMNKFKDAAGYFAPAGSEFSFAAWDRQLRTGKRERLTDQEILDTAQKTIGSYKYRQLRLQFGNYPNDLQRAWLRNQRSLIAAQYPGFPEKAVFVVGKLESFVDELERAAADTSVRDEPVTQAISTYLEARRQALAEAEQNGISLAQSAAAQPLRDWLLAQANALISTTPEFARVFDRQLAAEIED